MDSRWALASALRTGGAAGSSAWLALAQRAPVGHVGVETEYGHDNDNDIGNAGAISNGNDNAADDTKAASNVMIMLNRVHVQILVC